MTSLLLIKKKKKKLIENFAQVSMSDNAEPPGHRPRVLVSIQA